MSKIVRDYWCGNDYSETMVPYLDVQLCAVPEDADEMFCLIELLLHTDNPRSSKLVQQNPEPLRNHTETDGTNYIVTPNGFHKVNNIKSNINTLSGRNELIQTNNDLHKCWLIDKVIRDND